MSDLVSLVMKAAANELLYQEASQVDQEMQELLTQMALEPLVRGRLKDLTLRFLALLKRRSEIAQRALGRHGADFLVLFDPSACLDAVNHHADLSMLGGQPESGGDEAPKLTVPGRPSHRVPAESGG